MIKTNDWQKIYSAYSPKLLGICRRYIQDISTAEDILQDSFITAIQNIHQLKDKTLLFAWLKKIVINNALQYLRKASKNVFITTEPSEIPEASFAMNDNNEEKSHVLAYDFTREELLSSIDSLPSHHKSVFNLYFIENYSHAEIANQLGISVNTSKSHLSRAKKTVQNYLLNKVVNPDTPKNKNKVTQLLIFLGFAGLLWAQSFRSKFSDFTITPSKTLQIPESIIPQRSGISLNAQFSRKNGAVIGGGVILFFILISSVFMFRPQSSSFFRNSISTESRETIENKKENNDHTNSYSATKSAQNERNTREGKTFFEKKEIPEEKTSSIKPKKQYLSIKDSMSGDPAPQKVIVVKKIIQRDTIYIER